MKSSLPRNTGGTFAVLALDLFTSVLNKTDDLDNLFFDLAQQLRELTGARTLAIVQFESIEGAPDYRLLCVAPARRSTMFSKKTGSKLLELAVKIDEPAFWDPDDVNEYAGELLVGFDHGLSLVMPVAVAGRRYGALIALGLLNRTYAESLLEVHSALSGTIAIILRNAQLMEELKQHRDNLSGLVQKRTAELLESEELFRTFFENEPGYCYMVSPDARILDVNRSALDTLGYEKHELVGRPLRTIYAPESQEKMRTLVSKWKEKGALRDEEMVIISKGGEERTVLLSAARIRARDGSIFRSISVQRDITERKTAEDELRKQSERLDLSQEAAGMGMFDWDIVSDQTVCNDRYFQMFGLETQDRMLSEEDWLSVVHPDDRRRAREEVRRTLEEGVPYVTEYRVVWPNESVRWLSSKAKVSNDVDGRPCRMIGAMMDITERKLAEQELRQHRDHLEQMVEDRTADLAVANSELEAFAYSISHDLRGPLRAIDGFSQAVLEDCGDQVSEIGKDYLNRVCSGAQRMGEMINDILQISRLSYIKMKRQEVDLVALTQAVVGVLRSAEPHRAVEVEVTPGLVVVADTTLLESALQNLLSNAWKFTSVRDDARIEVGQEQIDGETVFFVRDNGAGFDMAYADRIFGVFQRLHGEREFPGTGIGLAIVQRVIHRHGGRVWGTGEVNEGATFYFTLPK